MRGLETSLRRMLDRSGIEIAGFADLSGILDGELQAYTHAVSIVVRLSPTVIDSIAEGPNQAYCEAYRAANARLDRTSTRIERQIREHGHQALAIAASRRTDFARILGAFPHKTAATRAGLGWIGKSSLLVTREYGPRVRLSTILTDYPFKGAQPIEKSYCGTCTACLESCPASAISGSSWTPGAAREELVDAHRCDALKKEHYAAFCDGHVCGMCVSVCPFGTRRGSSPG